ncbi:lysophospholipase L1-like esterase [Lutibacter sp. Hel_I_33_5]|uniref:SGNH/GDSL hydrolase family protein n=1 Tax=Lutibacter sp. Hel_I_33_5 TaxID=1566289 RepID=UPI0011A18C88|nr:GDSL-type esterase/lipase family protein [Lutibacter sp. Hel_I_33_5]TVZ56446.1 lysophospholipase L1-like esterase [Lutibacter sp. Hel_I_33_5]
MTSCFFFGDSITLGENDSVFGGWVDILKRTYFKEFNTGNPQVKIFNLGIGGETTHGLLKRIEVETDARKSPENNIIFIGYGANDLAIVDTNFVVPLSIFENNIEKGIQLAKKTTQKIILLSILPISDAIDGIQLEPGKTRVSSDVIKYNVCLQKIALKYNLQYVDLHKKFIKNKEVFLSHDGVHPNEKGYQFIAEILNPIVNTQI